MFLSDISVKRPVFATVISLMLVLFGLFAFQKLPVREYPDVNPPIVSIQTTYLGASAEIIETKVTQLIEGMISGLEGVRTIESVSQDGFSQIKIEFEITRDVDAAAADVRDRVSRILKDLPKEADPPEVTKMDINTQEIIWLRLTSEQFDVMELTDYADRMLVDRLAVVDGVAKVRIGGERRYAMRIWLDRKALAARQLTVEDIENALRRENVELPAGRLESYKREFTVRVKRLYETVEDFKGLVIKGASTGYLTRLGDVAEIEVGPEDKRTEFRSNGLAVIGLGIAKQSRANTLSVAQGIRKEMEAIIPTLPEGITLGVAYDSSLFIDSAINEVYHTFTIAIFLVVLVIFLFIGDLRATLIPAITIPISLISAFIFLYLLDYSINLLTLLALVLSIGLVVDDAIVVLENIYKRIEQGVTPLSAAYLGTRQVAFAVIATTAAVAAVFVPISFMGGEVGRLFNEFAFAVVGAVLISGVISLSLCPMLCSKILKKPEEKKRPLSVLFEKMFGKVQGGYSVTLNWSLNHRTIVGLLVLASLPLMFFLFKWIPTEYEPQEDRGAFLVMVQTPEGASLEYTKMYMRQIEDMLSPLLASGEANQTMTIIPQGFQAAGAVNSGVGIVLLEPWEKRERHANQIVGELLGKFKGLPGAMAYPFVLKGLTKGFSRPVEFVIQGNSYQELAEWRDLLLGQLKDYPGLIAVDYDYKETKPQYLISIDPDRAASLGVSNEAIGRTLATMLGSSKVTTYLDRGEEYQVVLQGKEDERRSPTDLNNIYVRSQTTHQLIPLSNLVTMQEVADSASLNRFNRLRSITISANIAPGYTQGQVLAELEKTARRVLPQSAVFDYKGESRTFKETSSSFIFAFVFAIAIIYLVLSAQFESFLHPLVILIIVPFSVLGALLGLFFWNVTLNIYSQIGLLMLIGLAAKNSILIVEFINQLRDEGKELMEAVKEASLFRLRPILMTSLATAIGAVPLVIATGAGAESRQSIGVVVFVGVLFATFLSLYVVPVFYIQIAGRSKSPLTITKQLENELEQIEKGN